MSSSSESPQIPTTIGKYKIVGRLGEGGFGIVYEGRDPFLERRVAIKTCTAEGEELRNRFFREAEIAGNLRHRNIVTVHNFGTREGVPYLVQEYLSGEDLDNLIARRAPLTVRRRLEILRDVAVGLRQAHSQGVVHRDVKPANIRLTDDNQVKIMDFGVAKLTNVASRLTKTGMALGTAAYLPPEQIRGKGVDHRADIFSYGVTAYELLTYGRPFDGKTISALFFEIIHRPAPSLTERWPDCPPSLAELVSRCLAKDLKDRYASFTPVLEDLDAVLREIDTSSASIEGTTRVLLDRDREKKSSDVLTRATALLETGDFDGAEKAVEEASEELPADEASDLEISFATARKDRLMAQAAAAREEGDLEGALETLRELRKLEPEDAEVREQEQEVRREMMGETKRAQLATDLKTLRGLLARGDYDRVEQFLRLARSTYGDAPELKEIEAELEASRREENDEAGPAEPETEEATRLLGPEEIGARGARQAQASPSRPPTGEPREPPTPPRGSSTAAGAPEGEPEVRIPPEDARDVARRAGVPWRLLALVGAALILLLLVAWWSLRVGASGETSTETARVTQEEVSREEVEEEQLAAEAESRADQEAGPLYLAGEEGVTPAELRELPPIELGTELEEETQVLLYVLVDSRGRVVNVRILEDGDLPPEAVEAVREAASEATFDPATREGVPGQQWTTLRVAIPAGG